jgi:molybdenum cofactor synthesis domain-containing protein
MISIDEARQYVFSCLGELEPAWAPLEDALGCASAHEIVATEPIPGFANSAMDGYALRSADTNDDVVQLRVVEQILAGDVARSEVGPGECMRIMTGAPLPAGADCVEMIEEISVGMDGSVIEIHRRLDLGNFVRHAGDDVKVGDRLVEVGDVINPTRIGVIAGQGIEKVLVRPRPRVGIFSTGNELTDQAGPLAPGAIRDTNRPMLMALARDAGVEPIDLGAIPDDYDSVVRALSGAVELCDAVVTTGGVSMGDADFVKVVIAELAPQNARSVQVAMRPGKPFAFGVVGDRRVPIFGLPGNPVSTRVSFEIFVRPSLRRIAGRPNDGRPRFNAILDCALERRPDGKAHLVHVQCQIGDDGRVHVTGVTREGSHLLHAVSSANGIAEVPDGDDLAPGSIVPVTIIAPETLGVDEPGE